MNSAITRYGVIGVSGLCSLAAHGAQQPGVPEPLRLYQSVRAACDHVFDEDFVSLVVSFPESSPHQ